MNYEEYKESLRNEFASYTDAYDSSDTKIKLKIDHTYCVADFCLQIAKSLNLKDEDTILAWTCGMLHDIGRFEQIRRFGTFVDAKSVDHANFGADLLFQENLYERLVKENITEDQKNIVEKAIRVHSLFRIPEELTDRELLFAKILRDADKVDIFRAIGSAPLDEIYNNTIEEFKTAEVSPELKLAFNQRRCAKRDDRHTAIDYLIGNICMLFELEFDYSVKLAHEQGYIYKLLGFESDNEHTKEWFEYMRVSIWEFVASKI